jgi:hypothetical protein
LSRDPEGFQEIEKNCSSRGTIFQEFSLPMNDRDPVEKPARQTPNNTHCHRTGDRVFHADIAAVPEPSAALLGVLGVTGVLALGRRRA